MRWEAKIQGETVTVRVSRDASGAVDDIHAEVGSVGSPASMLLGCIWRSASIALKAGVPLEKVLKGLRGHKSAPSGETTDPLVPECSGLMDYVARAVEARAG